MPPSCTDFLNHIRYSCSVDRSKDYEWLDNFHGNINFFSHVILPYREIWFLHGFAFPLMLLLNCLRVLKLSQNHRPFVEMTPPIVSIDQNEIKQINPINVSDQCRNAVHMLYCWPPDPASLPSPAEQK